MEVRKLNSNVSVLQPKKSQTPNHHNNYVKKVHRRRILMIGIIFVIILTVFGVQIFNAHRTYTNTMEQIEVSKQKLDKQKSTQQDLKLEVSQLHNTNYLEKYIREKYMYSKPGEQIYNLPDDVKTTTIQK
ncbi:FtsB family cell division protein [Companilactobacillus farciminis]|uniref:FtsB family cell division protein n=1 Tax=Companilactobacillus farciminis TaxID=1612 RepID=UPI0019168B2A|nr:septum formation initiator family protein [Companilactobacillus farciminis]